MANKPKFDPKAMKSGKAAKGKPNPFAAKPAKKGAARGR